MGLETRFSLDELEYLRGLADFPDASPHVGNCMELGWQRYDLGRRDSPFCKDAGFADCHDLWCHLLEDGKAYYRHGSEALARRGGHRSVQRILTEAENDELIEWVCSLHAHEAVPA